MHVPDGFLDPTTAIACGVLAAAGVAAALRGARRTLPPERLPLLGTAAAFVFAAQMLNFPVAAGTSGHLLGATLVAILLGTPAATVVMTCVIVLQCLLFQDGGLTALGGNLLTMAVVAPSVGAAVHAPLARALGGSLRARVAAAVVAGFASTLAAAVLCAALLASSGTVAWGAALPAMAVVHALVGVGEGLATALVLAAVARRRPDLVAPTATEGAPGPAPVASLAALGLVVAAALVVFVAPLACGWPGGLEHVATSLGFERAAAPPPLAAPWGDYEIPVLGAGPVATIAAGLLGAAAAFLVAWFVARRVVPVGVAQASAHAADAGRT